MKIIIDTNLLVACMFNKESASAQIIGLAEKGAVDVMWHRRIRDEAELITGKIGRSVPNVKIDLDKVFKAENEVKKMPKVEGASEDREDDKFLACAIAAKADMIVSSDEHLLALKSFKGIPIYNSGRALKIISSAGVVQGRGNK
jgi:putative PIN family toxin of toxin-antitoxin system